MKHLIKLISQRLQKWYYYQELKEISLAALLISGIWFLYNYGITMLKFIFTEKGLIISAFFFASVIIAIAIKMYYRIMVIKYYEKDTNIELFKHLKGLIIGGFTDMKDTTIPFGTDIYSLINYHVKDYKFPISYGFPVSHNTENIALKIGVNHELKVTTNGVSLKEIW